MARKRLAAEQIVTKLRQIGVRIALDDFGTGYSSLSYLRSFPFDKIKIDRSFVKNLSSGGEESAIVRMVIGLAVRVQPQLDRMHDLNNGGFLVHRNRMENEGETETDNTSGLGRTGCERHSAGNKEAVFG